MTAMDIDLPGEIKLIAELPGHSDRAWAIAWNPARPLLASCSADKSVRLYGYRETQEGHENPIPLKFAFNSVIDTGHTKSVRALAWSPTGNTLTTGSFDSNILIWQEGDADDDRGSGDWECASTLEGHETECKDLAYSASGTLLATCGRDKSIWIWEVMPDVEFECMGVLMEHTQDVKCVAWHPKEELLASGSYDDTVRLWIDDPQEEWGCVAILRGHTSTVWSVAFSPDGNYLASASDDLTIRIWKRLQGHEWNCVRVLEGQHDRPIYSVTWGEGKDKNKPGELGWIASASGDGKIIVWDITESADGVAATILGRISSAHGVYDINSIAWCPRNGHEDLLATCGDDGIAKVWKVTTS